MLPGIVWRTTAHAPTSTPPSPSWPGSALGTLTRLPRPSQDCPRGADGLWEKSQADQNRRCRREGAFHDSSLNKHAM
ncbi:hypothetical protein NHX12_026386 [Muraenolepis orangiensis]|uniref:Uncharacterized protein n=1 Tax=Muraenolepis orangiensis TaxID=630683 RepID=A0A9Q0IQP1_9TELE|nr:hypothetical protein NHX12_026386 [Muraenolepis orangiensis]